MSFANKANGRDYMNKSNQNSNKNQTMSYRNTLTNSQYSNSSNGDLYTYDDKSQQSCNSPKILTESHGVPQHNTSPRDPYYKNNNPRIKQYHNKNYNDKHGNYYNQRSNSPEDVVIPEIEHLREFILEQTDRFKFELSRHESQTSNSPSPGAHQYGDHSNNRYAKHCSSLGRTGNGLSSSHSLGSIANSSNITAPLIASTVSPSCSDNSNRHPDARVGSNSFSVIKNNINGFNYNKHPSPNSGKPSPGLTRNLSHDETFSKSPSISNSTNRNDSPFNNADKSGCNKVQFPCPSSSTGSKPDPKKVSYRQGSFTIASGSNLLMHQMNQNNSVTALSLANDLRKNEPLPRSTKSDVRRNGTNTQIRPTTNTTGARLDGEIDVVSNNRAVVSVFDTVPRRISHSGSTTDSQEVAHSAIDTPTAHEQFFTPDPSGSPCSVRSSPDVAAQNFHCQRGGQSKNNNRQL